MQTEQILAVAWLIPAVCVGAVIWGSGDPLDDAVCVGLFWPFWAVAIPVILIARRLMRHAD